MNIGIVYKIKFLSRTTLFICLCLQLFHARCQDAQFSQFDNSFILMNPSLTGAFDGNFRMQFNSKIQWSSISVPYKTFAFSNDMAFKKKNEKNGFFGVGLSLFYDKAGSSQLGLNQVNTSFAYHTRISKYTNFSGGILAGFAQRGINYDKLQWNSQYDGSNYNPSLPSYEIGYSENKTYLDIGAGLEWTYTKGVMYSTINNQLFINAGIAVFHVNKPNISFYSSSVDILPLKVVLHGKTIIGFSDTKYSLIPSLLYMQQGTQKNIIAAGLIRKKLIEGLNNTSINKIGAISFGCLYRYGDAIIPCTLLEFSDYTIGLSYDINISGLIKATSGKGGFEISLRWLHHNSFSDKKH